MGELGCENSKKKKKKYMRTHVFMQASDCVINYLNKNKFFVAPSTLCDAFCTLTSKNAIFVCLVEISVVVVFFFVFFFVNFFSGLCLNSIPCQ